MVRGASSGPAPGRPGPCQQLPAHPIQLADVAHRKLRRKVPRQEHPQGGWRLDYAADGASRPAGAQHVGVVNAVAASQTLPPRKRGADATRVMILVARVGSAWCIAQVQARRSTSSGKAQVAGPAWRGRISPALVDQAVVVEGDLDAVGVVHLVASFGCSLFLGLDFSVPKTIIPDAQEHFLTPSARRNTHLFGGLGVTLLGTD